MDMDTRNGCIQEKLGCNAYKSAGKLEYTPQAEGFHSYFLFSLCPFFEPFRRKKYHGFIG